MNIYPAESLLNGSITDSATSLTLASVAGFIAPFYLVLEDEIIDISSPPSGNTFNGIERGALGTAPASHPGGTPAYELYSDAFPFAGMGPAPNWFSSIAAELRTLEARAAAEAIRLPRIVATVNRQNQTASFTVELIANPDGDYELNDYVLVTTDDAGATMTYGVTWADEAGPAGTIALPVSLGSAPKPFSVMGLLLLNSGIAATSQGGPTIPASIHASPGTPITATFTISGATTLSFNYHATLTQNR
jgi:hypothetical protein